MKTSFSLLFFMSLYIVTFTSCYKDAANNPTLMQIDSLNTALPKEIITSYSYDSSGVIVPDSYVVAFKYDTVNSVIQLYFDDTTTTTSLYDKLAETFSYNSSGYLTSVKVADDINDTDQNSDPNFNVTVNRDGNNKIIYVSETSKDGNVYDSIFYNYQAVSGGTNITTINHYRENVSNSGTDTMTYNYTSNNDLTQVTDLSFQTVTNYILNAKNTVKSYTTIADGDTTSASYVYASGLADGKADVFLQALLGKDYYLPVIFYQDPFIYSYNASSDYDDFDISFSDPYHISAATVQDNNYGNPVTETATWMYQLNAENNVTQVNFSNSLNDLETVKIKY